ncbi:MAG: hypothetical protein MJK14_02250, partial [Rivularia sp. ALOHA_DT_140]|nr:hypothetical protein [Rivularia sp. ALOHA_DT_140]
HRAQLGFPQIVWQNITRSFKPQEKQARAGDPANFMAMAQGVNAQGNPPQRISPYNIDISKSVPYRQSNTDSSRFAVPSRN